MTNPRRAEVSRTTSETTVNCAITLDGTGACEARTGLGFLDHMLDALARHARIDLRVIAEGDLAVDDHHTVEDVAIVLGQAIDRALGDRSGIARYGWALTPMDEALCQSAIDLSGRPVSVVNLGLRRDAVGEVASENLTHFFQTIAVSMRAAVHIDVLRGENDHHRAEAAFKGFAIALRQAVALAGAGVPSTKGVL